ncbi:hypothetical protein F4780DRAFT_767814 [Xylariomycetidae sp. FL0641]|nr:hypothetical protein F4780DRAFT_767814 [Xylariomycetidae sp. FL0641]
MSKILAVFGATGQQGGSVIDFVLADPELSQQYSVRAITRDVHSRKSRDLAKRVEVVHGDASDRASLETALRGAHSVFAMTAPAFGSPDPAEAEFAQARTIADVAAERGVRFLVFSTLPGVRRLSGGKYNTLATAFDAKARAEAHIRGLPSASPLAAASAFYCPASFMENLGAPGSLWQPRRDPDGGGGWTFAAHVPGSARLPLLAAAADTGKFVGAMLADPGAFAGRTVCAAARAYSLDELAAAMARATGRPVAYRQVPEAEVRAALPPVLADVMVELLAYVAEFGYFGPGSDAAVAEAVPLARGTLTSLEEYLRAHPLRLEE